MGNAEARALSDSERDRPHLVGVLVYTFPSLDRISIGQNPLAEIGAVGFAVHLSVQPDSVRVALIVPLLSTEVIIALPNLQTNAIRGI